MADKKKPAVGATVPPPSKQGEDFFSQLKGTFERGIVSAEIDVGGLLNEQGGGKSVVTMFGEAAGITSGPAGVHNQIFHKMRDIANAFGGKFTVHAPMQANPADTMRVGQARAANLLKQTFEYADKLGAKVVTVHPIGQMETYFVDPFIGTKIPVGNQFYLAKNEQELNQLMDKFNVRDPLVRNQIKREWSNFIGTLPMTFAEKFSAIATQDMQNFAVVAAKKNILDLAERYKNNPTRLRKEINDFRGLLNPNVRSQFDQLANALFINGNLNENLINNLRSEKKLFERDLNHLWPRVAMTSLDPVDLNGTSVPLEDKNLVNKIRNGTATNAELYEASRKLREKAWGKVVTMRERFGPYEDSEKEIMNAVKSTFSQFFDGLKKNKKSALYKKFKKGELKISLENLFPSAPEQGVMQGYAYFYTPEHMAKLIKAIRKIAKDKGFSPDSVTMTFDVGHAVASSHALVDKKGNKMKPSEFLAKLRKLGVKPGHFHVVGGPGYGHAHMAWGDWLDEVSRMDPTIFEKLTEAGVINIEGGAGMHDIEVTLNAMWNNGMPLEAMLAAASSPEGFNPGLAQYAGFQPGPYLNNAQPYAGTQFAQRSFYSFKGETFGAPMGSSFGGYTAPALFGGGYSFSPGRQPPAFWSSSQPLLYSSKSGND